MFTGIIEALGTVGELQLRNAEWRVRVDSRQLDFSDVRLGDIRKPGHQTELKFTEKENAPGGPETLATDSRAGCRLS